MNSLPKYRRPYLILAVIIFGIEVLIAKFAHDKVIRPYIGDFLVVILIYCFIKSILDTPVLPTAISVLLFAYFVEIFQYYHIIDKLGLQRNRIARIVMGTSFEWMDIIAYTGGIVLVLSIENIFSSSKDSRKAPVDVC